MQTWGHGMADLSAKDQKLVMRAHRALQSVSTNGAPQTVFDALRPCTPVVGGMIGTLTPGTVDALVSHAVGLPGEVLEGWFNTPPEQMLMMLSPLIVASGGELISDTQAITGPMRDQLDLWRVMPKSGLGESAGYMVSDPDEQPQRLTFLTLALDGGAQFTPRDRAMLQLVRGGIQAALARVNLPLIASQSILAQIMEDRRMGFILVSQKTIQCIEMNLRARDLVGNYNQSARVANDKNVVQSFAMRAVFETRKKSEWILLHNQGKGEVEVTVHELKKEQHAIGEDLWLVMLKETEYPEQSEIFARYLLSVREAEIARLLLETSLSNKEIATQLGSSFETVRTQVGTIYRKCRVHTRGELFFKLRGRRPS